MGGGICSTSYANPLFGTVGTQQVLCSALACLMVWGKTRCAVLAWLMCFSYCVCLFAVPTPAAVTYCALAWLYRGLKL